MTAMLNRLAQGLLIFAVTFAVAALVTLGWNAAFEGRAVVDWGTSTVLAVVYAIVLPIAVGVRDRRPIQS